MKLNKKNIAVLCVRKKCKLHRLYRSYGTFNY